MADTGIFATTLEVQRKAGAYANATATDEAYINDFITQAESQINVDTEYNWSDVYTDLNVDVKGILKLAASNFAAMYVIIYDPNSWTLQTANLKLNVLWNGYMEAIKILRNKDKAQIFMTEA